MKAEISRIESNIVRAKKAKRNPKTRRNDKRVVDAILTSYQTRLIQLRVNLFASQSRNEGESPVDGK